MMFQNIFERLKTSERNIMLVVPAVIGVLGGLSAILFRHLITLIQSIGYGDETYSLKLIESLEWWHVVLVPAVGGLLIGPVIHYFARETKGHGVPEVMEAVAVRQGVIRKRIVAAKTIVSAITIGTGGSVGREGPIVQIGSAIGSALGQILRVSRSRLRTLVGCGAAAGIAATFNAPVAGVLFSLEIILGDFGIRRFTPIVVSSVIATATSHHFLGDTPAFQIAATYELVSPIELLSYSILGVAAGLVAVIFTKMVYGSEDLFDRLRIPFILKPALGGLLIGFIGLKFPQVFGVGYETIEMALNEEIAWNLLFLVLISKLLATSLTLGSGGSGGIFAPSLLLGAALGGGMGHAFHGVIPDYTASSGAYALVGMGAVVSAATHAPLTSIMIIFEMTGDYRIILPLMFACIIGQTTASLMSKHSIYTMKLLRRGLNILGGKEVNVLTSLNVKSVLSSDYITIREDTTLGSMLQLIMKHPHTHIYVTDAKGSFKGVVVVDDLRQAILEYQTLQNIVIAMDIMSDEIPRVHEGDTLDKVMRLFGTTKLEELPVIEDDGSDILAGIVTRQALIGAYNKEILKRDALSEMLAGVGSVAEKTPVILSDGIAITEIEAPGWMEGKSLVELDLRQSRGIQVLMINSSKESRQGQSEPPQLVPRPDYRIRLGDNLVVLGPDDAIRAL
jgi:CIC family chloride channel protein